jgi:hypothetical protein
MEENTFVKENIKIIFKKLAIQLASMDESITKLKVMQIMMGFSPIVMNHSFKPHQVLMNYLDLKNLHENYCLKRLIMNKIQIGKLE